MEKARRESVRRVFHSVDIKVLNSGPELLSMEDSIHTWY